MVRKPRASHGRVLRWPARTGDDPPTGRCLGTAGVNLVLARAERMATIPARRYGTAAEFGAMCAFLCSVHAGYMTGQNILMDGGQYPGTY